MLNFLKIKEKVKKFGIFAEDNDQVVGGALIYEHSDALYIDVLWFKEDYRKKGIGTKILELTNEIADSKNIKNKFVDTYAFQAEAFYKNGFVHIATVPGYPVGHDRIFLKKNL